MFCGIGAANSANPIDERADYQDEIVVFPIVGVAEISDVDRVLQPAAEKQPAYCDTGRHPPVAQYVVTHIDMLIIVIVLESADQDEIVALIRNWSVPLTKLCPCWQRPSESKQQRQELCKHAKIITKRTSAFHPFALSVNVVSLLYALTRPLCPRASP
jgi:hypothetical protein